MRRKDMTQFRVSKKLIKHGISPEKQGLIFFACLNIKDLDPHIQQRIANVCVEVAGDDYQALYKFLTDAYVNHVYICNTYFISKTKLFKLKNEFYLRILKN